MDAEARTVFVSLLTDTYRNAQPMMISTGSAIYAAFVRADASSGARYVVVTKFDGTSWSEPVQVDGGAILDSSPVLCADGGDVYLAYARTTSAPGDSLLSYALKQEIQTYENNLGFLTASSKKGNSLIEEMNRKIQKLKDDMQLVKEKIKAIDAENQ